MIYITFWVLISSVHLFRCYNYGNFDTYEIPRFSWVPKIETVLIENNDLAPQGGGEPPIVCMGALIANAIYDAVGVRLFHLPMTPERIKEALKKL